MLSLSLTCNDRAPSLSLSLLLLHPLSHGIRGGGRRQSPPPRPRRLPRARPPLGGALFTTPSFHRALSLPLRFLLQHPRFRWCFPRWCFLPANARLSCIFFSSLCCPLWSPEGALAPSSATCWIALWRPVPHHLFCRNFQRFVDLRFVFFGGSFACIFSPAMEFFACCVFQQRFRRLLRVQNTLQASVFPTHSRGLPLGIILHRSGGIFEAFLLLFWSFQPAVRTVSGLDSA